MFVYSRFWLEDGTGFLLTEDNFYLLQEIGDDGTPHTIKGRERDIHTKNRVLSFIPNYLRNNSFKLEDRSIVFTVDDRST